MAHCPHPDFTAGQPFDPDVDDSDYDSGCEGMPPLAADAGDDVDPYQPGGVDPIQRCC